MDPLTYLLPAVYTALSAPALTVEGASVPVFQHLPEPLAGHYVLLTQPTAVDEGGSADCMGWSCTLLIDVVTQFPTRAINTIPSQQLAAAILERLHRAADGIRPRLTLPDAWDCGPASLVLNQGLDDPAAPGQQLFAYRRLIRLRWPVYYHVPATPQPEPDPDNLLLAFVVNGGPLPRVLV